MKMKNQTPRFKTKAGRLTPYALACGYLEKHLAGEIETTLWQESPGVYAFHVRQHDFGLRGRIFWEAFDTLTTARNFYDKACRKAERGQA